MKKIIASAFAGLLAVSFCITAFALDVNPLQWKNIWLDYGYNQGTSQTQWGGEQLRMVNAQVRRRSDNYVVTYNQIESYYGIAVTASGSWNYSNYKNTGLCYAV